MICEDGPEGVCLSERWHVATKDHRCTCGKTIPRGQKYMAIAYLDDGHKFGYDRWCALSRIGQCIHDDQRGGD